MNENERKNFRDEFYKLCITKSLKKSYIDILRNPTGFVRGIPPQLANDIRIIKSEKIPSNLNKEEYYRLKEICELSVNQMSKNRRMKENSSLLIYDYFTKYKEFLVSLNSIYGNKWD